MVVLTRADRVLALDPDTCVGILRACGFLPNRGFGVVNLGKIPDSLNAEQLERFLRQQGAETCGLHSAQNQGGSAGSARAT
jgi:hypothetical protein